MMPIVYYTSIVVKSRTVAELNVEQLAERTGESVESLHEWRAAGLLRDDDRLGPEDAECVRLIRFLLQRGFNLETITRAVSRRGGLLADFANQEFPTGRFPIYTLAEAAEKASVDVAFVWRVWEAAGFGSIGDALNDDDLDALDALRTALDGGLPEHSVIELVRVYADALRRVAEAEIRLFHFYVHEALRAAGASDAELQQVDDAGGDELRGLTEPAVLYFHRKGWMSAARDDLALHVAEAADLAEVPDVAGTLSAAIVFVDLARFTPLTEVMGDAVAADVIDRFSGIVRPCVAACHGRIVKQIGDAYMLIFFEPTAAVGCALAIEERAAAEPQFPAVRAGAHWGPVLYREGDYVGATVNLASRLEAEAGPHQLLVTPELRMAAEGLPDAEFVPLETRTLKGVSERVDLYEARRISGAPRDKTVDPVCGMELGPSEIAATLDVSGETRAFCSTDCLQRFVAHPEPYQL
jgi:adenylate cyclase